MIEVALAKNLHTAKLEWNDWHNVRDSFNQELRQFIDDKLRAHSRGVVDFEVADNKYYIAMRTKKRLNYFSHIIFYKAKGGEYTMLAVNDGVPVSKSMMMLAFSEALQQK